MENTYPFYIVVKNSHQRYCCITLVVGKHQSCDEIFHPYITHLILLGCLVRYTFFLYTLSKALVKSLTIYSVIIFFMEVDRYVMLF